MSASNSLAWKFCNKAMPFVCASWLTYTAIHIAQGSIIRDILQTATSRTSLALIMLFILCKTFSDLESLVQQYFKTKTIGPVMMAFLRIVAMTTLFGFVISIIS